MWYKGGLPSTILVGAFHLTVRISVRGSLFSSSLVRFLLGFCPGLLSLPEDKISVLLASIRKVSTSRTITPMMLAQVTGQIIS